VEAKLLTLEDLADFAAGIDGMLAVMFGDSECSVMVGVGPKAEQMLVAVTREEHRFVAAITTETFYQAEIDLKALQSAAAYEIYQEWTRRVPT
jgi:hypothetical protein